MEKESQQAQKVGPSEGQEMSSKSKPTLTLICRSCGEEGQLRNGMCHPCRKLNQRRHVKCEEVNLTTQTTKAEGPLAQLPPPTQSVEQSSDPQKNGTPYQESKKPPSPKVHCIWCGRKRAEKGEDEC